MRIRARDFSAEQISPGGFFRSARWAPVDDALREASAWVTQNNIRIINIETVVMPNIWNSGEEGTKDAHTVTSGEMHSSWYQFIRVWYWSDE